MDQLSITKVQPIASYSVFNIFRYCPINRTGTKTSLDTGSIFVSNDIPYNIIILYFFIHNIVNLLCNI